MSAYGTSTPYYAPPRACQTVGLRPTPHARRVAGVQATPTATPAPQPLSIWSHPTSKGQAAAVASQALTGFLLRPIRIV